MPQRSPVQKVPAAESSPAVEHFRSKFAFETDCWDVHYSIENDLLDFVILDVRSEALFRAGHVPTAIHLPHAKIRTSTLPPLAAGSIYVVYCAGPHCNGSTKAALRIAELGLPVKEMIGGVEGWKDEGFALVT